MYSIDFDNDLIKGVDLIDIDYLNPMKKLLKKRKLYSLNLLSLTIAIISSHL